jgi:transcriptional regulator with XRE-family HTH domain
MEIGEFLSELRKEKGLLQKEVACYLKVTVSTVSNYEKDVHAPDLDALAKLADLFDVSTDYLLQRTDCRTSISALNRPLAAGYTAGDLLNLLSRLDERSIEDLLNYYELLCLRSSLQHDQQP